MYFGTITFPNEMQIRKRFPSESLEVLSPFVTEGHVTLKQIWHAAEQSGSALGGRRPALVT